MSINPIINGSKSAVLNAASKAKTITGNALNIGKAKLAQAGKIASEKGDVFVKTVAEKSENGAKSFRNFISEHSTALGKAGKIIGGAAAAILLVAGISKITDSQTNYGDDDIIIY